MRYTVVGGNIAAASAIKAIRSHDPKGSITVVCDEQPFYYRPLIPMIIAGAKRKDDIGFRDDIAEIYGVDIIRSRAVSLDEKRREVVLENGTVSSWDRLCIATGASARRIDVTGGERVLSMRNLADAIELDTQCGSARSAVVIGGGFVGVKTCEALLKRGLRVTLVEEQPHVLAHYVDPEGAHILERALAESGADVVLGDTVAEVRADGVLLASGRSLPADVAVAAVGTRPNIAWLAGSSIFTERGIRVDEALETTTDGVYAAGDVVEGRELLSGRKEVSALWHVAAEMGKIAGANMAGQDHSYPGFLGVMNATEVAGIPVVSAGRVVDDHGEVFSRRVNGLYRKLVFDDDRLRGMVMFGDVANAGIYAACIRNGTRLGNNKAKAIDGTLSAADFTPVLVG